MPRRKPNPFTNRKASVSVHRNGLTIEVSDVNASDAGVVAKGLLDVVRTLVQAGYDELIVDAGGAHGGTFGEVPEDEDDGDWVLPPEAKKRPIGFRV